MALSGSKLCRMLTFKRCLQAGFTNDRKNVIFAMLGEDDKRYEFAIPSGPFIHMFAMGWKAAKDLVAPSSLTGR
jgi:hypothetical protein